VTAVGEVPLWRWIAVVDVILALLFAFGALLRLLFIILSRLSVRNRTLQELYYTLIPFERTLTAVTWGVSLVLLYPIAFVPILGVDYDSIIWATCRTLFAITLALGVKDLLRTLYELYTFRSIRRNAHDVIQKEQYLFEMEGNSLAEVVLWDTVLTRNSSVLPTSRSRAVKKMEVVMEKMHNATEAANHIVEEIILKDDKKEFTTNELKNLFGDLIPKVLKSFDTDNDGKLNKTDISTSLLTIWKERKHVLSWMKSRRLMLDVSDKILSFAFYVSLFFIILSLFVEQFEPIQWNTVAVSMGTILIALSFAYGKVLQNLFDSLYLIFLLKPFEVGDIIRVGDLSDELIVESVGVMSTYFIRKSTGFGVYISNALLAANKLSNYNRGEAVNLVIPFQISIKATQENVLDIKSRVRQFMDTQKEVFSDGKILLVIDSVHRKQKLYNASLTIKLQKWVRHQDNDWKEAQSDVILFLNGMLFEMGLNVNTSRELEEPF